METIVALSTPPAIAAIHIIRVSGNKTYQLINKITKQKISKEGYKIQRAQIVDNNKLIDDVLLMKFVSPNSYTGEDLIEINCHGSLFIVQAIINLLISKGAKLAERGEFTKRAFLNNKLNLIQAESVNLLCKSNSNISLNIAHKCIDKKTSENFIKISSELFKIIGHMEIDIDYPEYNDTPKLTKTQIKDQLVSIIKKLEQIIEESLLIVPLVNGINVAIVGKPNVGKSSLLNAILKEEKAIVSSVPGTTRDTLQYSANIGDLRYNFIDTAGIHKPNNKIESLGISLSKKTIKKSNLVIFVVDGNKPITNEDKSILNLLRNKKYIVAINKCDKFTKSKVDIKGVKISAKKNIITPLINEIIKTSQQIDYSSTSIILPSTNSINQAKYAVKLINIFIKNINQPIDLIINYLHEAYELVLGIINKSNNINFIDQLFADFCVGK